MKRTAAVLGPTPPFIRWAIGQECDLRDTDVENLADQTFRQLRNVRELSDGYREHRVIEEICFHPAPIGDVSLVRAFPTSEVFDFFGDADCLTGRCGDCPANCTAHIDTDWAGCFGLLPTNLNFTFGHTSQSQVLPNDSLVTLVNAAMQEDHGFYRLWKERWIAEDNLANLNTIFQSINDRRTYNQPLQQFADACQRCSKHGMRLYAELVPSGFSDGIHWKLNRACEACRFESDQPREKGTPCPACKNRHADDYGRKAKVLGLRPYLILQRVLGKEQTEKVVDRYQAHLKEHQNDIRSN